MSNFRTGSIKPSNAELNRICHLLALLGAHHILHVSRLGVNGVATCQPIQPTARYVQNFVTVIPQVKMRPLKFSLLQGNFAVSILCCSKSCRILTALKAQFSDFSPDPESIGLSGSLSCSSVTVNLERRTDGKFKFLIS
jgi:hypothetical protein